MSSYEFGKYKNHLKHYLNSKGVDVSKSPTRCFNQTAHKHGDANPSCQLWDDRFKCYGCGIEGDIYDAVEILEGIKDKKEQYEFIEKFFNGGSVSKIDYKPIVSDSGKEFKPDPAAMKVFEEHLRKNPASRDQIKKFLCERAEATVSSVKAYPADIEEYLINQLFYWPGLDDVRSNLGNDILKKTGIPLKNPKTGYSTWDHSGVVMKLGTGYKLHYYQKNYCDNCKEVCEKYKKGGFCKPCEKRNSKGGKTFPMPGAIDAALPVILVEGEMNALSCAGIGIKNLFATGGTNGLTAPKVKRYLLNVPEIILFFDSDAAGRKASGLDPLTESDARKSNIPQIIKRAGYTGIIKLAELPPVSETGYKDQDGLIIAGKREIITYVLQAAREYIAPPPQKKIYTPFEKFNHLSIKRLQCLLKRLNLKSLDKDDIAPFVSSVLSAFPHDETKPLLRRWGIAEKDLIINPEISPYELLTIIAKHLSRYMVTEIEREITPVEEFIKQVKIQDTKFDLDFEEIEISQNARNFFYTGGIRSAALMLADIFNGKIIYNDAKNDKRFYFFDGHVWKHEPDIAGVIYNTMLSVLVHLAKQRKKNNENTNTEQTEIDNKRFHSILKNIEDRRIRKDIEREFSDLKAEGIYHNSDDKYDDLHFDGEAIRETLTLQDCVFDMSGDKIVYRKSRANEYRKETLPYTMKQVRDLPVKYFWEFMRGNFKDEKTLETFMFYLSLIASRRQFKYCAFLIGGKNTGKSTTMKLIKNIYKHLIGSMPADVLVPKGRTFAQGNGPNPYIAELEGLCASIVMETEDGATLNAEWYKRLTGDDPIPARGLHEKPKTFLNTAQIIIATNMLPKFDRHDASIIERMVVIPFLVEHDRGAKDTILSENIIETLTPELPAIVRIFGEYYLKLKNEYKGIIPISKESNSYKMEVISEAETDLDKFVSVNIAFETGKMERIKDVYDKYINYFEFDENSVKRGEALSRIRFTKFILKNYKKYINESTQRVHGFDPARVFVGLRLKTIQEIEEDSLRQSENASTQEAQKPQAAQSQIVTAPRPEPIEEEPF